MTALRQLGYDVASRRIRDVRPMDLPPDAHGHWSCTRCGRQHPVDRSRAVRFESNGRLLAFVVCAECAERYRVPAPVTLDLQRLPTPDHAEGKLRTITAHAWFVSNVRQRPPERVLRLRDADVRHLALQNRETPTNLVRRLEDQGLLATA